MNLVIYYTDGSGAHAMRLDVPPGTDVKATAIVELGHRKVEGAVVQAWEPVEDALLAKEAFKAESGKRLMGQRDMQAFRSSRIAALAQPQRMVPVAKPPPVHAASHAAAQGFDWTVRVEKGRLFIDEAQPGANRVNPADLDALEARLLASAVPFPYNVEPDPAPGPAGLLLQSPMDGRLGNRWSPA